VRARRAGASLLGALALLVVGCGGGNAGSRSTTAVSPTGPVRAASPDRLLLGATFDGPVLGPHVDLDAQMALAAASSVQSLRVAVSWAAAEPRAAIPPDFTATDRIVLAAARRHLAVLPTVLYTPSWAGGGPPNAPPRDPASYGRFLTALVGRYGPSGSLWHAHPEVPADPVRMWQIWNEPDFPRYWAVQPFAASYVRLLAAAHAAIKAADPGAQVVLAGLPEFSWQYLTQILAVPGAGGDFDIAAAHPYTAAPAGVLTILERDRAALDAHGAAAKPLLATEVTWPSSEGHAPPQFGVGVTEAAQAQRIDALLPMLAAARHRLRLLGAFWYTWMGDESPAAGPYAFNYAGLLAYRSGQVIAKPALAAFRRQAAAVESGAAG
jgi:polysaccharide biosynthesis protein PslG